MKKVIHLNSDGIVTRVSVWDENTPFPYLGEENTHLVVEMEHTAHIGCRRLQDGTFQSFADWVKEQNPDADSDGDEDEEDQNIISRTWQTMKGWLS